MQPRIRYWPTISQNLGDIDCIGGVTQAFRDDSLGLSVIPPIGERQFEAPRGEAHIEYECIRGEQSYIPLVSTKTPPLGCRLVPARGCFFFEQSIVVLK